MQSDYQENEIVVITKDKRSGTCGVLGRFAKGIWGVDLCNVTEIGKTKHVGYHESDFIHFRPFGFVMSR